MLMFLTSSPGGCVEYDSTKPSAFDNSNGFVDKLKEHWHHEMKLLIIASAPSEYEINDVMRNMFVNAFRLSGIPVDKAETCDMRNPLISVERIQSYDIIILSGGHVPTENAFFKKLKLKECIETFNGIVIGISAGTMNCAQTVYAMPEEVGESINPDYKRFITGLGLTNVNIIPHYQYLKEICLDGKRVIEDIGIEDSYGKEFYCLVDGSYLLIEKGTETIYGEAYLIKDGKIVKICDKDGTYLVVKS